MGTDIVEKKYLASLYSENGVAKFLQNACAFLPNYTASQAEYSIFYSQ
jgi:hypothetical protein